MTSESKVLTVSYGAFSCTLEGFDNPFDTMKVIAEYFRDLAQNDRYFGAEPPQPDAALLHRAAEREIARLVGNRANEAGQAGRPTNSTGGEVTVSAAPVATPEMGETPVSPDQPPLEQPVEPTLQDEIPKGFTAKLARIRASSKPAPDTPALPQDQLQAFMPAVAADLVEAEVMNRLGDLIRSPDAAEPVLEATPEPLALLDESPAEAPLPEAQADELQADELVAPEVLAPEVLATELVSPALEADTAPEVAAEVAKIVTDAAPDSEVKAVPDAEPATDALVAKLMGATLAAEAGNTTAESDVPEVALDPSVEDTLPEDGPDPFAAVFADGLSEDAFDDLLPEQAGEQAGEQEDAAIRVDLAGMTSNFTTDDPVSTKAVAEDLELAAAEDLAEALAAEPLAGDDPAISQVGQTGAKGSGRYERISSRVVRIRGEEEDAGKDAEPEAAPDLNATRIIRNRGADVEMSRLLRQAENVMADEENRRRQDAIALMKAAVVVAESDRAASDVDAPPVEDKQDVYRDDLAQAVEPMPAPPEPERPMPKRRKTRSVRLPETRPGTIRPNSFSPPPLVLVTEQRIDRAPPPLSPPPVAATAAPEPALQPAARDFLPKVALRTGRLTGAIGIGSAAALSTSVQHRVVLDNAYPAGHAEAEDEDELEEALSQDVETGLGRFAERLGLTSTVDLLEAAAAFATCVEKRSQFTRPQLMRRLIATAPTGAISREDGLRSFGTLLRTGRIEKIGRGNYALSQNSPFLIEARRFS